MGALLVRASLSAAAVAILEILVVIALGWRLPLWTLIGLPCVAECVAFLIAGRLRVLRRQRRRRRVVSSPSRGPRVAGENGIRRAPTGAHDLELVAIPADDDRFGQ